MINTTPQCTSSIYKAHTGSYSKETIVTPMRNEVMPNNLNKNAPSMAHMSEIAT
jgi:hypothetical protein